MSSVELAVISVAGLGSRLGMNMPKCLVSIGGKTMIERQLELLTDVPQVRVVVGYKEQDVVDHVRTLRDDVIFVRNRNYDSTSLQQSMYLGIRHWKGAFLALEGDVIFEPTAFARFLGQCKAPGLLGVTPSSTDNALYVTGNGKSVDGFTRSPVQPMEWSGLGYLDASWIKDENVFAYEALVPHLPMESMVVPAFEIDTPSDLERAHHVVRSGDWAVQQPTAEARFGVRSEGARSFAQG